jgi:hypothetical protein
MSHKKMSFCWVGAVEFELALHAGYRLGLPALANSTTEASGYCMLLSRVFSVTCGRGEGGILLAGLEF